MANILIVDDSAVARQIIMRGIRQAGLKVEGFAEAADGVQALAHLDAARRDKHAYARVDLILSDLQMPNMDGLDFVERVRAEHGDATPIVMIAPDGVDEMIDEAIRRGANGRLRKPFSPNNLQEVLGPHLA